MRINRHLFFLLSSTKAAASNRAKSDEFALIVACTFIMLYCIFSPGS